MNIIQPNAKGFALNPMDPEDDTNIDDVRSGNVSASTIATKYSDLNQDNFLEKLREEAQYSEAAREKLYGYYFDLYRDKTANEWTAQREDSQWQRAVADLQKAGLSPYVLSGGTPSASRATVSSSNGSQMTSSKNNEATNDRASRTALLTLLGIFLTAALHAI